MTVLSLVLFVMGLGVLVVGAETLVRGSTRLGRLAGLSPLVVGLTIVSFATTAPEATVSIVAASEGKSSLALGNVLGSNVFNILVVVGAAAIVTILPVQSRTVRMDVPVLIGATALVFGLASDGTVTAVEGGLLLVALVVFVGFTVIQSRKEARATAEGRIARTRRQAMREVAVGIVGVGIGGGLLIFGSRLFVQSATDIASALGVSELVVGLTVVAAGTSAPELTTSIVAAFRRETDVAVGNAIGASVINLLGIIGLTSVIADGGLVVPDPALRFDFPFALAVALAALPITVTGFRIGRWKGIFMLGYYAAYVTSLILGAFNRRELQPISEVTIGYILPLTIVTTAVVLYRIWNRRRRAARV